MDERTDELTELTDEELRQILELGDATMEESPGEASASPAEAPAVDVAALQARITDLEKQLAEAQTAVRFYQQFTDPDLAPLAVQELMQWAQSMGYLPTSRRSASWSESEEEEVESASNPLETKVQQLETELQRFLIEQRRREAVEQAARLITGWAKEQGVTASPDFVNAVIQEASALVRTDMDNATVQKILRMVYDHKTNEQRQSAVSTPPVERPLRKTEVTVGTSTVEDDILVQMDRVLAEYLK